jgi:hypothetical protein
MKVSERAFNIGYAILKYDFKARLQSMFVWFYIMKVLYSVLKYPSYSYVSLEESVLWREFQLCFVRYVCHLTWKIVVHHSYVYWCVCSTSLVRLLSFINIEMWYFTWNYMLVFLIYRGNIILNSVFKFRVLFKLSITH